MNHNRYHLYHYYNTSPENIHSTNIQHGNPQLQQPPQQPSSIQPTQQPQLKAHIQPHLQPHISLKPHLSLQPPIQPPLQHSPQLQTQLQNQLQGQLPQQLQHQLQPQLQQQPQIPQSLNQHQREVQISTIASPQQTFGDRTLVGYKNQSKEPIEAKLPARTLPVNQHVIIPCKRASEPQNLPNNISFIKNLDFSSFEQFVPLFNIEVNRTQESYHEGVITGSCNLESVEPLMQLLAHMAGREPVFRVFTEETWQSYMNSGFLESTGNLSGKQMGPLSNIQIEQVVYPKNQQAIQVYERKRKLKLDQSHNIQANELQLYAVSTNFRSLLKNMGYRKMGNKASEFIGEYCFIFDPPDATISRLAVNLAKTAIDNPQSITVRIRGVISNEIAWNSLVHYLQLMEKRLTDTVKFDTIPKKQQTKMF